MNTTKKLLVLCLVALMGVVSVMPSTFSWFNHSDVRSGDKMNYTRKELPVSGSEITMKTEYLTMEKDDSGNELNTLHYDEKGNKIVDKTKGKDGEITNDTTQSITIPAGHAQYFRTTFENTGTATSMVSIQLANLSNMQKVRLGTITPTVNEHAFSGRASLTRAANSKLRVYLKVPVNIKSWSTADKISIVVNENTTNKIAMTKLTAKRYNANVWYGDLPAGTTTYYFYNHAGDTDKTNHWHRTASINEYKHDTFLTLENEKTQDGNDYTAINTDEYRLFVKIPTNLLSSSSMSVVVNGNTGNAVSMQRLKSASGSDYTEDSSYIWYADLPNSVKTYYVKIGSSQTAQYDFQRNTTVTIASGTTSGKQNSSTSRVTGLISVTKWYSKLSIIAGQTAQISLSNGTDYIGDRSKNLTYSVTGSSKITVNNNTGTVKAADDMSYGTTATIKTTIKGVLGDEMTLETEVVSPEKLSTVPIAQNIKVLPEGKSTVEWYIMNGENKPAVFDCVFYTE